MSCTFSPPQVHFSVFVSIEFIIISMAVISIIYSTFAVIKTLHAPENAVLEIHGSGNWSWSAWVWSNILVLKYPSYMIAKLKTEASSGEIDAIGQQKASTKLTLQMGELEKGWGNERGIILIQTKAIHIPTSLFWTRKTGTK